MFLTGTGSATETHQINDPIWQEGTPLESQKKLGNVSLHLFMLPKCSLRDNYQELNYDVLKLRIDPRLIYKRTKWELKHRAYIFDENR